MKELDRKHKVFTFSLLSIILLSSPIILLSYPKPVAIISIFRENIRIGESVIINGYIAKDGQTITSSSAIETSTSGTDLTVYLSRGRRVNFGSNTKMTLAFDENKISGVLLRGSVKVLVQPNTILDIQTKDGFIEVFNENQENNIVIDFVDGKTRVKTVSGLATLNGISITGGQYFIFGERSIKNFDSTSNSTSFVYTTVLITLFILAVLGDTSDLDINSSQINVGPMR